jgi:hypothetical protein
MKRFYFRFRILLFTLALGLASVPFFSGFGIEQENAIKLPVIESESPLIVTVNKPQKSEIDEIVKRGRGLTSYAYFGSFSNCLGFGRKISDKCEEEKRSARQFLWNSWQNKKTAHLTYNFDGVDSSSEHHIFVEPDESGKWHVLLVIERWGAPPNRGIFIKDIRRIKFKIAGEDDTPYEAGMKYLEFLDKNGEAVSWL